MVEHFRSVEMRTKLEECQKERVYKYKKQRPYIEGDKVWFQPRDSNAWFGPGTVVNHDGNIVWIRTGGDLRKVAQHKVQPYGDLTNDDEIEQADPPDVDDDTPENSSTKVNADNTSDEKQKGR